MFMERTSEEVMAEAVEDRGFESLDVIKSLNESSGGKRVRRGERSLDSKESFCCLGF